MALLISEPRPYRRRMDQPVHEPSATAPTMAMTSRRVVAVLVWALVLAVLFYFFRAFQVLFLGVLAAGCLAATLHPLMKYVPAKRAGSAVVVGLAPPLLAVGLRRSYGDSCLNDGGTLLDVTPLDRFIAFDRERGRTAAIEWNACTEHRTSRSRPRAAGRCRRTLRC